MNQKTIKIIMIFFVLIIFSFSFIKCASLGGSSSEQTDKATSRSIDISTMPANSEFLKDESE